MGIGYTQMPAYKHPLIAQRLGHGRGCPLDCPHYAGSDNRYPDGLCPVAERVIPRILTCATFIAEDACKANADKLRRVIEKLG
ncbi:MAG: hypothetical protein FJ272_22320 [Planctomycetes bacterium]|nr:hypothetical protein [Planctomycetota bacterium]